MIDLSDAAHYAATREKQLLDLLGSNPQYLSVLDDIRNDLSLQPDAMGTLLTLGAFSFGMGLSLSDALDLSAEAVDRKPD